MPSDAEHKDLQPLLPLPSTETPLVALHGAAAARLAGTRGGGGLRHIREVATREAPAAIGPYSQAILVRGVTLYCSGQVRAVLLLLLLLLLSLPLSLLLSLPLSLLLLQLLSLLLLLLLLTLHCSGEIGVDPATGTFAPGGVEAQAAQALRNLEAVLAAGGASAGMVVRTTVFLADLADFARVNALYELTFGVGGEPKPARACVQAAAALPAGALVGRLRRSLLL